MHPQALVDHRAGVIAHAAAAGPVVHGRAMAAHMRQQGVVILDLPSWQLLGLHALA
ncbi:hypothetical protein D3C71_2185160 [compost metagenome]